MLKKINRLTKNGSYKYLYTKGKTFGSPVLTLFFVKGNNTKVGFVVSNKIGKANIRNLLKRRMRAVVRELIPNFLINGQIVLKVKPNFADCDFDQIKKNIMYLLVKAGIIKY